MRTRFAPSPTGPLHLGHAYSALRAHDLAKKAGGRFILRIEDIDQGRSREEWEALIHEDLCWLGLSWETPVLRQSERRVAYRTALDSLWQRGFLYVCTCNRRDVLSAASAPNEGEPLVGPDGIVYPGTCRSKSRTHSPLPDGVALRLNMSLALKQFRAERSDLGASAPDGGRFQAFQETGRGPNGETGTIHSSYGHLLNNIGDVVLARRDFGTSYHLSVVVDDAFQDITHVVRGEDLFEATLIHVLLQHLLGLEVPAYLHHRLLRDDCGNRLAKRHDSMAIRSYREAGATPADIRDLVGL
ncbi:MAG: tRNA glutamyl-Q(34) synthetase GluQRS [Boseongicola sp.]|nr:tRNA glutamyl-Q(34) synthetase GluQRS [Boseongicola sp.]